MGRDQGNDDDDRDGVRLDKWLWAARFFKTRGLAHDAIDGGKVYIDGVRAKASRHVAIGQKLEINSPRGHMVVYVERVAAQRGPASVAVTLYRETDESRTQREELAAAHRLAAETAPNERPNSQDRKAIRRLKEG